MTVELTFLDSLGAIAVVIDPQGTILEWTHGFHELTGQLPYELSGRPLWELVSPNDQDGLRQALIDTVNDRKSRRVDAVMMNARFGERRIAWSCSLVSSAGDDSIVVWGIDVTATVGSSDAVAMSEVQSKLAAREHELSWIY